MRLRTTRGHMAFQPASAVRYTSDVGGFFEAAPEHVPVLISVGCERA
jgi:hypothetical protein